jgi:hypothetical protein
MKIPALSANCLAKFAAAGRALPLSISEYVLELFIVGAAANGLCELGAQGHPNVVHHSLKYEWRWQNCICA